MNAHLADCLCSGVRGSAIEELLARLVPILPNLGFRQPSSTRFTLSTVAWGNCCCTSFFAWPASDALTWVVLTSVAANSEVCLDRHACSSAAEQTFEQVRHPHGSSHPLHVLHVECVTEQRDQAGHVIPLSL